VKLARNREPRRASRPASLVGSWCLSCWQVCSPTLRYGDFTDYVELEDHGTQSKAIDMMLRMQGIRPDRRKLRILA
jgi:hypothetical protein